MTIQSRDWHAWLNTMPPGPHELHVAGDVLVGNPGIKAVLTMKEPQGINPAILMLDLHLVQEPGMWPQVLTWVPAKYNRVMPPKSTNIEAVEIYEKGEKIASIDHVPHIS
jgi:hypothetical protein